jgi:membrane dipeptidase
VERIGAERVGFGSDFDGAKVPREIGDASGLPQLFAALSQQGYDDAALKRLGHENWVRVLREIWHG